MTESELLVKLQDILDSGQKVVAAMEATPVGMIAEKFSEVRVTLGELAATIDGMIHDITQDGVTKE